MKNKNQLSIINYQLIIILTICCQLSVFNCFGQITRSQIFANADPFTSYTFTATSSNIHNNVSCSPVGNIITPSWVIVGHNTSMPYCWGGFSSRASFTTGLTNGKSAGDNDCTTNGDGSETCALGVDCSGFVSRSWALTTKYSTSTLPNISTAYTSASQVQLGDIFNYAGSHVRLVNTNYGNGSYQVMESSANGWHVAYNTYTASQLTSYVPRYYVNIVNAVSLDAGIASVATPNSTVCGSTFSPVVKLQNFGTTTLTSCTINYHYDSNSNQTFSWTGSLATGISTTVTLPSITVAAGTHTFICTTSNPNGGTDGNTSNDQSQNIFTIMNAPATLPLMESFQSSTFPPAGWTMHFPNSSDSAWRLCTTTGYNSSQCMFFPGNCGNAVNISGEIQQIYSPNYNFTSVTNPQMKFDVAYEPSSPPTYSDTLAIYSSIDCGTTWVHIYSKGGMTLCTTGGTTSGGMDVVNGCFVPPNSSAWRTDSINLSSLSGNSNVMFSFESRSGWGNIIYLDNINVSSSAATSVQNILESSDVKLFPNPSNGVFNLQTTQLENMTLQIYNAYGQCIRQQMSKSGNQQIDLSAEANGIYLLKIKCDQVEKTIKLVKE